MIPGVVSCSIDFVKRLPFHKIKWNEVSFVASPTRDEMPFSIALKNVTENSYYPSTKDLCSFYPGHDDDKKKYITSDYIMWKVCAIDKKRTKECGDPNAMVGLTVHSFNVENASEFLRKSHKRKRLVNATRPVEVESLLSDDEYDG